MAVNKLPSGRYRARHTDPATGRSISKSFDTRALAEKYETSVKHTRNVGTYVDPSTGAILLRDWATIWQVTEKQFLRPGSYANTRHSLAAHVLPTFGHLPLNAIDQPMIQAWVTRLSGIRAGATVLKQYRVLTKMLDDAVSAGYLQKTPAVGVRLPSGEPRDKMRLIRADQVLQLADAIEPRWRLFVLLGGFCGLRLGELTALRWGRITEFGETASLEVAENASAVDGQLVWGPPKTKAGFRRVEIPDPVMDELKVHADRFMPNTELDTLVLTGEHGGAINPQRFRQSVFYPACQRVGIEGFLIHDLRHTAISLWIASGANPKVIAVRAGHRSVTTVFDVYGHLLADAGVDSNDELTRRITKAKKANATAHLDAVPDLAEDAG